MTNLNYANPKPKTDFITTKRAFYCELLGTFAICYVGGLSVINLDLKNVPLLSVALAHTFVVSFFVWITANISGGHLNGAVSLGLFLSRHIGFAKLLWYNLAQTLGSFIAAILLHMHASEYHYDFKTKGSSLGFPHLDVDNWQLGICFMMETIGTF